MKTLNEAYIDSLLDLAKDKTEILVRIRIQIIYGTIIMMLLFMVIKHIIIQFLEI